MHKDTGECVAVKIVEVDDRREGGLTHEALRKEVCCAEGGDEGARNLPPPISAQNFVSEWK